jgi:hypothetical protein
MSKKQVSSEKQEDELAARLFEKFQPEVQSLLVSLELEYDHKCGGFTSPDFSAVLDPDDLETCEDSADVCRLIDEVHSSDKEELSEGLRTLIISLENAKLEAMSAADMSEEELASEVGTLPPSFFSKEELRELGENSSP